MNDTKGQFVLTLLPSQEHVCESCCVQICAKTRRCRHARCMQLLSDRSVDFSFPAVFRSFRSRRPAATAAVEPLYEFLMMNFVHAGTFISIPLRLAAAPTACQMSVNSRFKMNHANTAGNSSSYLVADISQGSLINCRGPHRHQQIIL